MPGKVEDLAEEAFTKAPPNRGLQALFVAFFVLPQLALYAYQKDHSAYTEFGSLLAPAAALKSWQRWLQDEKFVLAMVLLAFERMVYTIVWLFPAHFVHFAKTCLRPVLIHVGKDQPLDSASFLAYTPSGPFSVPQRKQEYVYEMVQLALSASSSSAKLPSGSASV